MCDICGCGETNDPEKKEEVVEEELEKNEEVKEEPKVEEIEETEVADAEGGVE